MDGLPTSNLTLKGDLLVPNTQVIPLETKPLLPDRGLILPDRKLAPLKHILNPNLSMAVEEYSSRLAERGDLAYENFSSDQLLLRAVSNDHSPDVVPNNRAGNSRYIGIGANLMPSMRDGFHCGQYDAVDREQLHYRTQPKKEILVPRSIFDHVTAGQFSRDTVHGFSTLKQTYLPSVNRTISQHLGDPALRKIENTFQISATRAIDDPFDYSFTRGFGRGVMLSQKGLTWQTARRFPGEYGVGFRNTLFFGRSGKPIYGLRHEGAVVDSSGVIPSAVLRTSKR